MPTTRAKLPLGQDRAAAAATTIADGLRTALSPRTLAAIRAGVDAIGTASERSDRSGDAYDLGAHEIVIEPSAAVPLACLLSARSRCMTPRSASFSAAACRSRSTAVAGLSGRRKLNRTALGHAELKQLSACNVRRDHARPHCRIHGRGGRRFAESDSLRPTRRNLARREELLGAVADADALIVRNRPASTASSSRPRASSASSAGWASASTISIFLPVKRAASR